MRSTTHFMATYLEEKDQFISNILWHQIFVNASENNDLLNKNRKGFETLFIVRVYSLSLIKSGPMYRFVFDQFYFLLSFFFKS